MKNHLPVALLAGALLLAPVLEAAEALGAESPQAAVEKLKKAAIEENFGDVASVLAPPARQELVKSLWAGTTMMLAMGLSQAGDTGEELATAFAEEEAEEAMEEMSEEAKAEAAKAKAEAAKARAQAKAEARAKLAPFKNRYDDLAKKYGLPTFDQQEGDASDATAIFAKADQVAMARDYYGLLSDVGSAVAKKAPKKKVEGELMDLKIDGDRATGTLLGDTAEFVKIDGRWFITKLPKVKKSENQQPS